MQQAANEGEGGVIIQPKVQRLGGRGWAAVSPDQWVRVDEKIDGSQITFGVFDGKLRIRSRGRDMSDDLAMGMFAEGLDAIRSVQHKLWSGYTYWGEYLQKPKHNVLAYERVPKNHVVLFDIASPDGNFLTAGSVELEAENIGTFEPVQLTFTRLGEVTANFFGRSQLGGITEGVVVKLGYGPDRLVGKLVSEQFREVKQDGTERSRENPNRDLDVAIANKYCPPARFAKAVQRLRENGEADGSMKDIPRLRDLLVADLEGECGEEIREDLYKAHQKNIRRHALGPLASWYQQLLQNDNAYWTQVRSNLDETR